MKTIEVKAQLRENVGKKDAKRLRKKGFVPCVLYGGTENIHFQAHENAFLKLVYTPKVYLAGLDIDGSKYTAIMQDIQFHPVTDKILHVDFFQVSDDKKVIMDIPVEMHGTAPGVKEGGKLKLEQRRLKVRGMLNDLPDTLVVDISNLSLGKTIKVGELEYENMELLNPDNTVVVSVKLTRAARGMAAASGEEETEEKPAEGEEETAAPAEK
ncbi:MAG: 50S ribosomal protein L25/general stress protein Ctc [Bacteroidetes bacterium]|nr:50S ribosomal protein L25/general stress protein Ctc [Bacteroidota bacterium]